MRSTTGTTRPGTARRWIAARAPVIIGGRKTCSAATISASAVSMGVGGARPGRRRTARSHRAAAASTRFAPSAASVSGGVFSMVESSRSSQAKASNNATERVAATRNAAAGFSARRAPPWHRLTAAPATRGSRRSAARHHRPAGAVGRQAGGGRQLHGCHSGTKRRRHPDQPQMRASSTTPRPRPAAAAAQWHPCWSGSTREQPRAPQEG